MAGSAIAIAAIAMASPLSAKRLVVNGEAKLTDGSPIPIGTVYTQELRRRKHAMPEPRLLKLGTTSAQGKFVLELDDLDGDLFVKLINDRCDWLGAQTLIKEEELRSRDEIEVVLVAERDVCKDEL